jgi:hypothetical protein
LVVVGDSHIYGMMYGEMLQHALGKNHDLIFEWLTYIRVPFFNMDVHRFKQFSKLKAQVGLILTSDGVIKDKTLILSCRCNLCLVPMSTNVCPYL